MKFLEGTRNFYFFKEREHAPTSCILSLPSFTIKKTNKKGFNNCTAHNTLLCLLLRRSMRKFLTFFKNIFSSSKISRRLSLIQKYDEFYKDFHRKFIFMQLTIIHIQRKWYFTLNFAYIFNQNQYYFRRLKTPN